MSENMSSKVFVMIITAINCFFGLKTVFPNKSYIINAIAFGTVAILILLCIVIVIGCTIIANKYEAEMEEKRKRPITIQELKEMIASFVNKSVDEVGNDDDLEECLDLGIFEKCELFEKIEDETGVEMPENIVCGIFTINEMVAYLRDNGKTVTE